MSRELPYFKFRPAEYNSGDIVLCSFEAQGLFVNLCAIYWSELGKLPYSKAIKRFPTASQKAWDELFEEGCIKLEDEDIRITFLDTQLDERGKLAIKNKHNIEKRWGVKPSKSSEKPTKNTSGTGVVYQSDTIENKKEKEKENKRDSISTTVLDSSSGVVTHSSASSTADAVGASKEPGIEERTEIFRNDVISAGGTIYTPRMLTEFISYWTEKTQRRKVAKLRFELERTWDVSKRLTTWASRSRSYACFLSDAERSLAMRKADFKKTLQGHLETYGRDILNEFFLWWTQPDKEGQMRWEAEEFWDVKARLESWQNKRPKTEDKNDTYKIPVSRTQ